MRSSTNIYNLSLMGAMIDHLGEAKAEAWAKGVRANLAREPKGGDTDQLKAVAAGECDVAHLEPVLLRAPAALEQARRARGRARSIGIVFPNQDELGHARQHLRRRRAEERAAPRQPPSSSSSTWRATRRSATSPTATTSGRWCRASRSTTRCSTRSASSSATRSTSRCSGKQPAELAEDLRPRRPGSSALEHVDHRQQSRPPRSRAKEAAASASRSSFARL